MQELLQRDIRIVRWFVETRWRRKLDPSSSLGRLLSLSEQADLRGPTKRIEELDRAVAHHGMYLGSTLVRVAWAVRALHGNGGRIDRVDGTFIDDELLGEDSTERDVERTLPLGVGTLIFAARFVQAGGGRILSINGHRGAGHDIKWKTGQGDTVYIERKDRSFEAGLADTPEKRIARVVGYTRSAGPKMPRERGSARVLIVGFQNLVHKTEQRCLDRHYSERLLKEFGRGRVRGSDLPHVVIAEHLGLEPRTGGAKLDFFSPHALSLKPRELMQRVLPLVVRALGVRRA
jgi:hypothetical protein